MGKTNGRFHIDHRTEVINKYVLYVEDLFVSFKEKEIKKELKNNLKDLKKELKQLSSHSLNEEAISRMEKKLKHTKKKLEAKEWISDEEKTKKKLKSHEASLEKLISKGGSEDLITLEKESIERTKSYLKAITEINYEKELKNEIEELKKEIEILNDPALIAKRQTEIVDRIHEFEEKIKNTTLKNELKKLKKDTKLELSLLKNALDEEVAAIKEKAGPELDSKSEKKIQKLEGAYQHRVDAINEEIEAVKEKLRLADPSVKRILNGVTFGVRKGETLAIVGANGAGKTVLLETILGLNIPDSFSRMVLNLGRKHYANNLKEVGIQYQQSKMSANVTVRRLIGDYKKLYLDRVNEALVEKMLDVFHIRPFYTSKVNSLSGGQKQRLNLLLAVINNPKLMILDEFITGLDVNSVEEIINFVNDLKIKLGSSMIIISHQPEEIEELADRVIVLKEGKVVLETYVEDIIEEYGDVTEFIREII